MNRRALFASIGLSTCGVALLFAHVRRLEREVSGGDPVLVLMARKALPRGAALTAEALAERPVPIAHVERRAVRAADRARVIGLHVESALQPTDGLLWSDLSLAEDDRDLSSLVQPGKRAVTIEPRGGSATSSRIRPGDTVDVLASERAGGGPARILLQKVLVLAVGASTQRELESGSAKSLTLSLDLGQSQRLTGALGRGGISVVLRNPEDDRVVLYEPQLEPERAGAPRLERPVAIGRNR